MSNPYQAPSELATTESEPHKPADPLRFPAIGCFVMAVIGFLFSILSIVVSILGLSLGRHFDGPWNLLTAGWLTLLLSILAVVVAPAMLRRRKRWLVVSSSILGLWACPPLAAIILMRLRRKEVWDSFERSPAWRCGSDRDGHQP